MTRRRQTFRHSDRARQAREGTLFCEGAATVGAAYLRSTRYQSINAMRDDVSVLPDNEGNLIVSIPENAVSFEEMKRRDRAELGALGLQSEYWK